MVMHNKFVICQGVAFEYKIKGHKDIRRPYGRWKAGT